MDEHTPIPSPTPKARRLRKVTLVRGRHTWLFVCGAGEEAQLVRSAAELLERSSVPMGRLHVAILARQLGVLQEHLNQPVRKAD
jgi:hypothetical protein